VAEMLDFDVALDLGPRHFDEPSLSASSRADCFLFFDDADERTVGVVDGAVGAVDGAVILVDGDHRLDEP
jgi:hypothetical protein